MQTRLRALLEPAIICVSKLVTELSPKLLCLILQHFLKRGFVELNHPRPNAAFLNIFKGYKENVAAQNLRESRGSFPLPGFKP